MQFALKEVAGWLGVSLATQVVVGGWSVDTRTLAPGDLFFALRGPVHDGHEHVAEAFERGAVAAVVDRDVDTPGLVLKVQDSLAALQTVAREARHEFQGEIVGVTGSAGKTTTKDVIAEMLAV